MKMPMMKCGHTAMAINGKKEPCCVICHGDPRSEIIDDLPELTGRLAKCGCGNTRESSIELAFFEYKGQDSLASKEMCKLCSYALTAHWPRWEYQILIVRDWFKHKNIKTDEIRTEHLPNKKAIEGYVKARISQLLSQTGILFSSGEQKGEIATKIYEAKAGYIKGPLPSGSEHDFVPHGIFKYDVFYCGCRGWD
ncbi:hypothetical protein LCGC14_0916080 [marine sediment metagenome]|uniref:Uncharacterized protein n=1 Tax=marine sediment metagenome TaxID=412755 RepID=A0A0F9PCZ8_9ZZZZ